MTRRAYLYFFLTFLLGVIVGAAGLFSFAWYRGRWHRDIPFDKQRIVQHLTRELKLNDQQIEQLNRIMDESGKKFEEFRKNAESQFQTLLNERRDQIRKILNPEQLAKFNDLVRRHDERMKHRPPHP